MRPLEAAVKHLQSIDSAWSLDLKILRDGIADAAARIEALEAKAAPSSAPTKPSTS